MTVAPDSLGGSEELERLQALAEKATKGLRHVTAGANGYPQEVWAKGVVLIAECFEGPQHPHVEASFIAACDPDTILSILAALSEAEARAERLDEKYERTLEESNQLLKEYNELTAELEAERSRSSRMEEALREWAESDDRGDTDTAELRANWHGYSTAQGEVLDILAALQPDSKEGGEE